MKRATRPGPKGSEPVLSRWHRIIDEFRRQYARQLLEAALGDVSEAAKLAELPRSAFVAIIHNSLKMSVEVDEIRRRFRKRRLAKYRQEGHWDHRPRRSFKPKPKAEPDPSTHNESTASDQ